MYAIFPSVDRDTVWNYHATHTSISQQMNKQKHEPRHRVPPIVTYITPEKVQLVLRSAAIHGETRDEAVVGRNKHQRNPRVRHFCQSSLRSFRESTILLRKSV
jgi:hypothetical protein